MKMTYTLRDFSMFCAGVSFLGVIASAASGRIGWLIFNLIFLVINLCFGGAKP